MGLGSQERRCCRWFATTGSLYEEAETLRPEIVQLGLPILRR